MSYTLLYHLFMVIWGMLSSSLQDPKRLARKQVAFQGASLVNVKEMAVGDMVSFDLGFAQKKNRPEAININKASEDFMRNLGVF